MLGGDEEEGLLWDCPNALSASVLLAALSTSVLPAADKPLAADTADDDGVCSTWDRLSDELDMRDLEPAAVV